MEKGRRHNESLVLPNYHKIRENAKDKDEGKEKPVGKLPSVHKNKKIERINVKLFRS